PEPKGGRSLRHRRVVRRIRKDGLDLRRERALRFGSCFHLLPFGIVVKRLPILRRRLAAGVRQDVDERVLLERRVLRLEVADARHAVPVEERQSVIPEPRVKRVELAFGSRVRPDLEHARVRLRVNRGPGPKQVAETEATCEHEHRHYEPRASDVPHGSSLQIELTRTHARVPRAGCRPDAASSSPAVLENRGYFAARTVASMPAIASGEDW